MVVGDFNGDGILDIATLDSTDENGSIYLGNGNGTFGMVPLSLGLSGVNSGSYLTMAVADFNGDGKLDLAVPLSTGSGGTVAVLLGNGDGTFQEANGSPITFGTLIANAAVGDFNGDGIADLMLGSETSGQDMYVLIGKGDGTFTQPTSPPLLPYYSGYALGDFNGDGLTDVADPGENSGTASIFLTAGTYSTASVTGISVAGTTVPQQVAATYSASGNYTASTSAPTSLMAEAAVPVFNPPSGIIIPGQSIAITSTMPGADIFYEPSGVLGSSYFMLYVAPFVIPGTGNLSIQAYATAPNYGQSATVTATYTVVAAYPVPSISSLAPAIGTAGGTAFTLTITGSNFVSSSTAYWGSTALTTQYVSATQLTAQVTAAQIAAAGTGAITVQSPAPGGGTSNTFQFEIDSAGSATPPLFTGSTGSVAPGSTATYSVTVPSSATGVSVTCLNLPTGASCSYSAGTLTIVTTSSTPAGTYQVTAVFTETLPGAASGLIFLPFLLLPLAGMRKKFKKESLWLIAFVALAVSVTVSGCGGGGSAGGGGGGGTGTQTHQATSSGTVTLTVQ